MERRSPRTKPTTTPTWSVLLLAIASCHTGVNGRRADAIEAPAQQPPVVRRRPTLQSKGPTDPLAAVKAALAARAASRGTALTGERATFAGAGASVASRPARLRGSATAVLAPGSARTLVLNVQDLLWAPSSFAAPEFDLLASGMTREAPERFEGSPLLSEDVLLDMIRAAVAPGTWDEPGNSIEIVDGKLFVTHD